MFSRVLIANRGEIALRVLRACKELGIETVCVYSEADRNQTYLRFADQAVCIGPPPPTESYLRADRIIAAAEVANVDAIHPGYGFLAENAHFADQCRDSKIEFIGPSAESMRQLGNKTQARKIARQAKVPTIPGSKDAVEDDQAIELAEKIGYPVMIKAVSGGGGRGMRIAHNEANLRSSLRQARSEAENAFKDPSLYLEKYIQRPRHVEVQILGDREGNLIHLHERDCSLQRRYQKLIEESPSPHISPKTREALYRAAVRLAREAGYYSAGTVEFLVDQVKRQIRIAGGETLDLKQRDIKPRGWAIECRINAEDPQNGFRPCPGTIQEYFAPGGVGVRVDTHVHPGTEISPRYDSLIGKLIVHRLTRAIRKSAATRPSSRARWTPTSSSEPGSREGRGRTGRASPAERGAQGHHDWTRPAGLGRGRR